jgi:hypothetical protein
MGWLFAEVWVGVARDNPATPEARMTGPTWAVVPMSSAK